MIIKILEYKVDRGNKVKVQSHNFHKGKWKINKEYEFHKLCIARTPARFRSHKEYEREVKE